MKKGFESRKKLCAKALPPFPSKPFGSGTIFKSK